MIFCCCKCSENDEEARSIQPNAFNNHVSLLQPTLCWTVNPLLTSHNEILHIAAIGFMVQTRKQTNKSKKISILAVYEKYVSPLDKSGILSTNIKYSVNCVQLRKTCFEKGLH